MQIPLRLIKKQVEAINTPQLAHRIQNKAVVVNKYRLLSIIQEYAWHKYISAGISLLNIKAREIYYQHKRLVLK